MTDGAKVDQAAKKEPRAEDPSPAQGPQAARNSARAASARRWIYASAALVVLGVAVSLTAMKEAGGTISLLGIAGCLLGLHRFGRSGPAGLPRAPHA